MKMFLISDNIDTKAGLRLAGVNGVVVHGREEALKALESAMKNKETGIILITELLVELFPEVISEIKLKAARPLVVEIPDRHGTRRSSDYIMRYVNEAIGIKV
ncbi:MAG TPA: ATP synthase subunit F [Ruminiclostridium sp.]|nr:ATP synthase subunit F [Ruminiclostridium sp.]